MDVKLNTGNHAGIKSKQNNNSKETYFQGISPFFVTDTLRFLDTEKAIGATTVDVVSMVAPRSIIDTVRKPDLGFETVFRESSTCLLHLAIGIFGVGAAKLLGNKFKKEYGVDASKLYANDDSIHTCAHFFHKAVKNNASSQKDTVEAYVKGIFSGVKGLDGKTWKPLYSENAENKEYNEVVKKMSKALLEGSDNYKMNKNDQEYILSQITQATGSRINLEIDLGNGKKIKTSGETILKDVYSLGKSFMDEKVMSTMKNVDNPLDSKFIKDLGKLTKGKTVLGLAMASLIAINLQRMNAWLTKRRTGQEGFVGVEGKAPDKSAGFFTMKTLTAGVMSALVLGSIAMGGKFRDIPKRLQFTSKIPHLDHFKVVYGVNLMGRIYASRDKNELRETGIRDFLGYTNWLIFGGIVTKVVANKLSGGKLINYDGNGKKLDWILNATVKSHDEIAEPLLKDKMYKNGVKQKYSKVLADKTLTGENIEKARKLISHLNIAHVSGIAYSMVVLGIGLPILNRYITEKKNKNTNKAPVNTIKNNANANNYTFMQNNKKLKEANKAVFSNFITKKN